MFLTLALPTALCLSIAVLISVAFPASLYYWGFWQYHDRDDVRVISRNLISSFICTMVSCWLVFFILITTVVTPNSSEEAPRSIWIALMQMGVNFPLIFVHSKSILGFIGMSIYYALLELYWVVIGILIVCTLFFGPLVDNIIQFTIVRNSSRKRRYLQAQFAKRNPHQNQSDQGLPIIFPFPEYEIAPLKDVIIYELTHWYDIFETEFFEKKISRHLLKIQATTVAMAAPVATQKTTTAQTIVKSSNYKLNTIIQNPTCILKLHKPILNYFKTQKKTWKSSFQQMHLHFINSLSILRPEHLVDVIEDKNIMTFRSVIVSPSIEEMIYRCCLYPLLYQYTQSLPRTIVYSAIFFGMAHLHHFYRHLKSAGFVTAFLRTIIQFTYCFLFALFCGYIYTLPYITTSTAHLLANQSHAQNGALPLVSLPCAIVTHVICNCFGLPSRGFMRESCPSYPYRNQISIAFIIGLISFFIGVIYIVPAS